MTSDQELAGLPEDVREALSYFADAETALEGEGHNGTMYATIRAELVRLARENAELRDNQFHDDGFIEAPNNDEVLYSRHYTNAVRALTARQAFAKSECAMLIAEQAFAREKSEAELAALKRRIAESTVGTLALCYNGHEPGFIGFNGPFKRGSTPELGRDYALLPVGG